MTKKNKLKLFTSVFGLIWLALFIVGLAAWIHGIGIAFSAGVLLGIIWLALFIVGLAAWIHGIVLAFSASVLLGIICIFIEIPFPVFAITYWITGVDLSQKIVEALPQIFG